MQDKLEGNEAGNYKKYLPLTKNHYLLGETRVQYDGMQQWLQHPEILLHELHSKG